MPKHNIRDIVLVCRSNICVQPILRATVSARKSQVFATSHRTIIAQRMPQGAAQPSQTKGRRLKKERAARVTLEAPGSARALAGRTSVYIATSIRLTATTFGLWPRFCCGDESLGCPDVLLVPVNVRGAFAEQVLHCLPCRGGQRKQFAPEPGQTLCRRFDQAHERPLTFKFFQPERQ